MWLFADNLGSIRDITNNSGTAINHLVWDSYGRLVSEYDPDINTLYGFTGRERDAETGLS